MKLVDKPLTDMQKKFARYYVEAFYGKEYLTNTEVAIKAGYAPDSSHQRAYELLNPRLSPHVVQYIGKLKEDFKIKHNIDPDKHMARLNHLGQIAEQNKNFGVSLRAEELRGKVAGYYIDRQIIKNKGVDDMTEEQLNEQIKKIEEDYRHILKPEEGSEDVKRKNDPKRKDQLITIIQTLEKMHNDIVMLQEAYMKEQTAMFHEKWKVRYLVRRIKEFNPDDPVTEEELDQQITSKEN